MNETLPKATVLIVEDEEGPRNALKVILRPFFQLCMANSRREALQILQERPIDVMTLDARLPDGNGLDLLRTVRHEYPWVETVMITGYGSLKSSQDALRAGASGYLLKPFNVKELIVLLNHTLEKKRRLDFVRNSLHSFHLRWTDQQAASKDWATLTAQYFSLPRSTPIPAPHARAYNEYLPLLSDIFEATDRHLLAHANRVRGYALLMADSLRLSVDEQQALSMGAFLHDLGRVAMKGHGRSDRDNHPEFGSQMVLPFRLPSDAIQIIRHHHEYYDGSGYPHGLKGEAISPLARIVGIAQAFDHLTAPSDDKTALSIDAASEQILAQAGASFDPHFAEVFVDQINESKDLLSALTAT